MPVNSLFAQVLDEANRASPYPFYARLRKTPVVREDDGTYVASTYAEIRNLLHDPRLSSADRPKPLHAKTGNPIWDFIVNPIKDWIIENHRPFIFRDPPDHTRLRRLVMTQFTAERVAQMKGRIHAIVDELTGKMAGRKEIDLVKDFAYPLPVSVICELLGVPSGDHAKFQKWSDSLVGVLDPQWQASEEEQFRTIADYEALMRYLSGLIKAKRKRPADDILSGLATFRDKKSGRMGKFDLLATAALLLVAGHETTVNLIANGMLTLLRHPEWLERLRQNTALAPQIVEEILRFDPPVQFRTRKALADVAIAGTVIPSGAWVVLVFAAGNRDPIRFAHPERFDPGRGDNQHFGFGGGPHFCLGAQLARLETEIALAALATRLIRPRLIRDPPPYRPGASLRGPAQLMLEIEGIA
ncbi:MAG: cytochrome P450 [Beijerinckiaceae bacterium]|nr:cytochrome P450 [Beijerinckiaceae bacterium]